MMDLNKHIVKSDDGQPFHSSGIARMANGDNFGAISSTSYSQRRQIDTNRRIILGYNRSAIGRTVNDTIKPKTYNRSMAGQIRSNLRSPSLQQYNSIGGGPRGFKEPPSRKYNPYS